MKRTEYTIEGWQGHRAIAFRRVSRPATVVRTAEHYAVDLGADRVIIRTGARVVAEVNAALTWQWVKDPKIEAALAAREQ